jgi:hypothetical protein
VTIGCHQSDSIERNDQTALGLLREMCTQPEFTAVDTSSSDLPFLCLGQSGKDDRWDFDVRHVEGVRRCSSVDFEHWRTQFAFEIGTPSQRHANDEAGVLAAHTTLQHDILVTNRSAVLAARDRLETRGVSVCSPCEALKIAALLLRSRHRYVLRADRTFVWNEDHIVFYNRLAWCHWPNVWPYAHACVYQRHKHELTELWSSLLFRATRALLACDYIGVEFYQPQDNHTRDFMHYHLDYLFLLLVGLFDVQALITERIYDLGIDDRACSFANKSYLRRLPPGPLHETLNSERATALQSMVKTLRNTIHGAQIQPLGVNGRDPERSLARLPPKIARRLPEWPTQFGGDNAWGITRDLVPSPDFGIAVEPFQAALTATRQVLWFVDEVARVTEIDRIGGARFASGPTGDGFQAWEMERTALMGCL